MHECLYTLSPASIGQQGVSKTIRLKSVVARLYGRAELVESGHFEALLVVYRD